MATDRLITWLQGSIVNPTITLLFAAALVYFIWGVAEYITKSSDSKAREEGKKHMIWGIVGMAIMVSAFAILSLALNTFGIDKPTKVNF